MSMTFLKTLRLGNILKLFAEVRHLKYYPHPDAIFRFGWASILAVVVAATLELWHSLGRH